MSEVEKIAKGLTEAQRRAMKENDYMHARVGEHAIPSFTPARCRFALQVKGLVEPSMYAIRLTPLGLAVRRHLEGQS